MLLYLEVSALRNLNRNASQRDPQTPGSIRMVAPARVEAVQYMSLRAR